eukprot:807463-Rhodomonas_salina.1
MSPDGEQVAAPFCIKNHALLQEECQVCLVLTFVRILPLARSKKRKICTGGCTVVVASKRHEGEPRQRRR